VARGRSRSRPDKRDPELTQIELALAEPEALRRLARFLGVNTVGADDQTVAARIGVQLAFSTQPKKRQP
jgi:hypothetical protein